MPGSIGVALSRLSDAPPHRPRAAQAAVPVVAEGLETLISRVEGVQTSNSARLSLIQATSPSTSVRSNARCMTSALSNRSHATPGRVPSQNATNR
jgi:hypothetical protein